MLGKGHSGFRKSDPGFPIVFLCNSSCISNRSRNSFVLLIFQSHIISKTAATGRARSTVMRILKVRTSFLLVFICNFSRISNRLHDISVRLFCWKSHGLRTAARDVEDRRSWRILTVRPVSALFRFYSYVQSRDLETVANGRVGQKSWWFQKSQPRVSISVLYYFFVYL